MLLDVRKQKVVRQGLAPIMSPLQRTGCDYDINQKRHHALNSYYFTKDLQLNFKNYQHTFRNIY